MWLMMAQMLQRTQYYMKKMSLTSHSLHPDHIKSEDAPLSTIVNIYITHIQNSWRERMEVKGQIFCWSLFRSCHPFSSASFLVRVLRLACTFSPSSLFPSFASFLLFLPHLCLLSFVFFLLFFQFFLLLLFPDPVSIFAWIIVLVSEVTLAWPYLFI